MFSAFRVFIILIFLAFTVALVPVRVLSAEILQISSSSVVQIGDQNRNYKVKLACLSIYPSKKEEAITWLRSELPRYTKVNILPKGSQDGILLSQIIKLSSKKDISESMSEIGLGDFICNK